MKPIYYLLETESESSLARRAFVAENANLIIDAAQKLSETFKAGNKVLIFGNGGSAADAQHMAAELVGRMLLPRNVSLPAIALTTDTSNLTAIGNDFGYQRVFAMQVEALAKPNDMVIGISTSGNSENVILGIEKAKSMQCFTLGLTAGMGGTLAGICDLTLCVEGAKNASRAQESHIFILHSIVDLMDRFFT